MCCGIENILSCVYLSGCGKPQGDVHMLNVQANTSSNLYLCTSQAVFTINLGKSTEKNTATTTHRMVMAIYRLEATKTLLGYKHCG